MATPSHSIVFWAPPVGASPDIAVGQVVIPDADEPDTWVKATAANRDSRRSEAIALSISSDAGFGAIELQQVGTIDASISGLGAGDASWVRCSATGRPERVAEPAADDDIIGRCETDGRLHLIFGVIDSTMLGAVGPIDLADPEAVTGLLGMVNGGLGIDASTEGDGVVAVAGGVAYIQDPADVSPPGGFDGDIQYKTGSGFGGMAELFFHPEFPKRLHYQYAHIHKEDFQLFIASGGTSGQGDGRGFSRIFWCGNSTTNATLTPLFNLNVFDVHVGNHDAHITVILELTYFHSAGGGGGGSLSYRASFKRLSGVLTRVGIVDKTDAALNYGTAVGGADIVTDAAYTNVGNIVVVGTGIAATTVSWHMRATFIVATHFNDSPGTEG